MANGKILKEKIFKNIWIQPAAGDAGGSLGGALQYWYHELGNKRRVKNDHLDEMKGSYLGPEYSNNEIKKQLEECGAIFEELNDKELIDHTAKSLSSGEAVGWFQGRMEFGPRALGGRSILGDQDQKQCKRI